MTFRKTKTFARSILLYNDSSFCKLWEETIKFLKGVFENNFITLLTAVTESSWYEKLSEKQIFVRLKAYFELFGIFGITYTLMFIRPHQSIELTSKRRGSLIQPKQKSHYTVSLRGCICFVYEPIDDLSMLQMISRCKL